MLVRLSGHVPAALVERGGDRRLPDRPTGSVDTEGALALRAALADLSVADRTVLVLRYLCDLSAAEVARDLGLTEGAVRTRTSGRQRACVRCWATTSSSRRRETTMTRDLGDWLADEADRAPSLDPATVSSGLELGRRAWPGGAGVRRG